ncbi:hypothetical protein GGTG_03099 [Gaeumannomyces tritici R3-111a-1]|uniref:Uncharacterized protein n=1 Tax=Gaeumannomyces tritici (strain R3-111a-1) TaxID=644352 RepID=J3NP93_GAET3|nr:hypothetical protein GGTG_03099 [Gaeumannomyces tritici R3-111a-1]EJT77996.1 hypothetical protein GGTG_03099 [Gaeumannomyces tritici R3-111a-1]
MLAPRRSKNAKANMRGRADAGRARPGSHECVCSELARSRKSRDRRNVNDKKHAGRGVFVARDWAPGWAAHVWCHHAGAAKPCGEAGTSMLRRLGAGEVRAEGSRFARIRAGSEAADRCIGAHHEGWVALLLRTPSHIDCLVGSKTRESSWREPRGSPGRGRRSPSNPWWAEQEAGAAAAGRGRAGAARGAGRASWWLVVGALGKPKAVAVAVAVGRGSPSWWQRCGYGGGCGWWLEVVDVEAGSGTFWSAGADIPAKPEGIKTPLPVLLSRARPRGQGQASMTTRGVAPPQEPTLHPPSPHTTILPLPCTCGAVTQPGLGSWA